MRSVASSEFILGHLKIYRPGAVLILFLAAPEPSLILQHSFAPLHLEIESSRDVYLQVTLRSLVKAIFCGRHEANKQRDSHRSRTRMRTKEDADLYCRPASYGEASDGSYLGQ